MLNLPQSALLEQTWLHYIYDSDKDIAIASKIWGDNMSLLEDISQMTQALKQLSIVQNYSVSAFRSSKIDFNTTGKLIETWEILSNSGSKTLARATFQKVVDFHETLIHDILRHSPESIKRELLLYTKELFSEYDTLLRDARAETSKEIDYIISGESGSFSLLSVWEIVAAKLMVYFLRLQEIDARYISTEINFWKNISRDVQVVEHLQKELSQAYTDNNFCIPIIPWYIGGIAGGILQELWRGYTDYTWAQAAVALDNMQHFDTVALYIQKLYGFKSTDPRKLSEATKARTVELLSYHLTEAAISHRGASAWLINPYALCEDIKKRDIPILVGNPTDASDIALINKDGCQKSRWVSLVLGREWNGNYDARKYGLVNVGWSEVDSKQVVYLMWENMEHIWEIYKSAQEVLKNNAIDVVAGASQFGKNWEISFVFSNKEIAITAQRILHAHFIESIK